MSSFREFAQSLLPLAGAGTAQVAHQLAQQPPEVQQAVMQHVGQQLAMNDAAASAPVSGFGYAPSQAAAAAPPPANMAAMGPPPAPVIAPPAAPISVISAGGMAPPAAPPTTALQTAGTHTGAPATHLPQPGDPGQPDFQNVTILGPGQMVPEGDSVGLASHVDEDRATAARLGEQGAADAHRLNLENEHVLQQQQAANRMKANADMAVNTKQQPFYQERIDMMEQTQTALKDLDNLEQKTYSTLQARQTEIGDRMFQMSQEHPEDIWGNASIGGKIAGLVGIVGAGLAGQDCTERVMKMANQAIQVHQNRFSMLKGAEGANQNLFKMNQEAFGSHETALKNMQANYLGIVASKMEQAAASMANPLAKANLMAQNAACLQKKMQIEQQVLQGGMANEMAALNANLHLDQIESQKQSSAMATNAAAGKERTAWAVGRTQSRVGAILDKTEHAKYAKVEAGGFGLIRGLDRVETLGRQLEQAVGNFGKDSDQAVAVRARYLAERDGLIKDWRSFTESGARIDPAEQKNYDTMVPSWLESALIGDLSGEYDRIHEARDMIVRSIRDSGDSAASGTSRFNSDLPLFAPSVARDIDHRRLKAFDYNQLPPEQQEILDANEQRRKDKLNREQGRTEENKGSILKRGQPIGSGRIFD